MDEYKYVNIWISIHWIPLPEYFVAHVAHTLATLYR